MGVAWTQYSVAQSSERAILPYVGVGCLITAAAIGPDVVRCVVLTVGMTWAVISLYCEAWRLGTVSPAPADLCTRCERGIIARGDRFYRSAICGARFRRASRSGPWIDAAGVAVHGS
jgi:hypothetical protein